jgi:hypothetical protein
MNENKVNGDVRIKFVPVRDVADRPAVVFSIKPLSHDLFDTSIVVTACSSGGWVFCGIGEFGEGNFLSCTGGTVTLQGGGWSGDNQEAAFVVTHDGVSDEIVVTYNTRAD